MIPVAEWSRARRATTAAPVAVEPKPLFPAKAAEAMEDCDEACDDLVLALALALQENARLAENARVRNSAHADLMALAKKLTQRIVDVAADESRLIADWVKSLLRPWIGARIEEAAIGSFVDEVTITFRRKLIASVSISAPDSMKEELQSQFAKLGLEVAVDASPDDELHATQGGTEVMTRISLWQEKLASLLA